MQGREDESIASCQLRAQIRQPFRFFRIFPFSNGPRGSRYLSGVELLSSVILGAVQVGALSQIGLRSVDEVGLEPVFPRQLGSSQRGPPALILKDSITRTRQSREQNAAGWAGEQPLHATPLPDEWIKREFEPVAVCCARVVLVMSRNLWEVDERALVCQEATLKGEVFVGAGSVVHPTCFVDARVGPIRIGADNIFEEQVEIVNTTPEVLVIGDKNIFEVGTKVTGVRSIGNSNVFETRCVLQPGVKIGDGCTVGVGVEVPENLTLDNEGVLYGPQSRSAVEKEAGFQHEAQLQRHLEILRETLPKSHYLKKNKKETAATDTSAAAASASPPAGATTPSSPPVPTTPPPQPAAPETPEAPSKAPRDRMIPPRPIAVSSSSGPSPTASPPAAATAAAAGGASPEAAAVEKPAEPSREERRERRLGTERGSRGAATGAVPGAEGAAAAGAAAASVGGRTSAAERTARASARPSRLSGAAAGAAAGTQRERRSAAK
ncbi:unnamed protein product [Vitrella brassicaformis CCMP3155]|uniref:Dynactin subunit 6 n=1 Tax=Vitrella brassicaformis (strain CCMP3155) TaxID=1169540 RepID=A0A0G4EPT2_VITBC|nr:unnamed protein product [Vitrella brassicaformis CCMP3155]|eukprot:CEL99576.1 unnamed protein product [Vitrella brassicaformis CCMP3155]